MGQRQKNQVAEEEQQSIEEDDFYNIHDMDVRF